MIKRLSLLIFSVIFCLTTFCCHADDVRRYTSAQIKSYVDNTPRNVENNIAPLVRYLTKPFNDDYDKAKAIAYWIASRIYYDDFLYSGTDNKDTYLRKGYQKQTPAKLLRSRTGICIDYANLFTAMCRKAGITARVIYGYAYPAQTAFSPAVRKITPMHGITFIIKAPKYMSTRLLWQAERSEQTPTPIRQNATGHCDSFERTIKLKA